MGVLSGVKVLDLTRLLPGPYCTLLMADYIRWRTPAIESIGARHLTVNRSQQVTSVFSLFINPTRLSYIFKMNHESNHFFVIKIQGSV